MIAQKIVVISFDHWNYDKYIVHQLKALGHQANHIKIGNFKHKNNLERIKNTFSKVFLGKNPKHIKRQDYIIETLEKLGKQDQILVINPELIDKNYHEKIKNYTSKYISYLYDSVARCNVRHLLDGVFDEVYSFDKDDIKQYHFQPTQNYNYIDQNQLKKKNIKQEIVYMASIDERLKKMYEIASYLIAHKISFKIIIVGKKSWKYQLLKKYFRLINKKHPITNNQIIFRRKRINQDEMLGLYQESNILLDLVRKNQIGLSFRIFEAMALGKKVITSNSALSTYDFYNEYNYLIIGEDLEKIEDFVNKPYQKPTKELYQKYTIAQWVKDVFKLT